MAKKKATAKKTAKKKTTTTTRKKRVKGPTPEEEWESLKTQIGIDKMIAYTMSGSFLANSAIEHPKFGVGIVTAAEPNKIQVSFREGTKYLIHNRS